MNHKTSVKWTSKSRSQRERETTAVALNYTERDMNAPQISVKGSNDIAKEMKSIAKRFGVPIHQSKELAERLSELEVSREIPSDLYEDMSKVFLAIENLSTK